MTGDNTENASDERPCALCGHRWDVCASPQVSTLPVARAGVIPVDRGVTVFAAGMGGGVEEAVGDLLDADSRGVAVRDTTHPELINFYPWTKVSYLTWEG